MASNTWSYGKGEALEDIPGQQGDMVQLPDGTMGTLAELVAMLGQQQQGQQQKKNYVPASLQAMIRAQGSQQGGMGGMGGFGQGGFGGGGYGSFGGGFHGR